MLSFSALRILAAALCGLTGLSVTAAERIQGNLVEASGFETCPSGRSANLPGWTSTGDHQQTVCGNGKYGSRPPTGQYALLFGTVDREYAGFEQEVPTTAGTSYTIGFTFGYISSIQPALDDSGSCDLRVRLLSHDHTIVYYDASPSSSQKNAAFASPNAFLRVTRPSFSDVPGPAILSIEGFCTWQYLMVDDVALYESSRPQPSIYNRRKARRSIESLWS